MGIVIIGRRNMKDTTDYVCLEYIMTGQFADCKEQMEQFKSLLTDDAQKEVILPSIND